MPITAPNNLAQTAGVPSQWSEEFIGTLDNLIVGETPALVIVDLPLALGQTLLAYTPVKWNEDSTGLVAATVDEPAIGITLRDIVVAATGTLPGVGILRAGCLNKDAITWPTAFNTDELKFNAFEGAPTPTAIVVRKVYRGAIVAQP